MTAPHTWTTQAGEKIEVAWMTTPHLIHSFNMVMRKNNFSPDGVAVRIRKNLGDVFQAMHTELRRRQRLRWQAPGTPAQNQLQLDGARRETPQQLAMLRAILDTAPLTDSISVEFMANPDKVIERIMTVPYADRDIAAKFIEYRLR